MSYEVEFTRTADREFRRLSRGLQERIRDAVNALGDDPHPLGSVPVGNSDLHRIRVGAWRVLYEVNDAIFLVRIAHIRTRGDVYRTRFR